MDNALVECVSSTPYSYSLSVDPTRHYGFRSNFRQYYNYNSGLPDRVAHPRNNTKNTHIGGNRHVLKQKKPTDILSVIFAKQGC